MERPRRDAEDARDEEDEEEEGDATALVTFVRLLLAAEDEEDMAGRSQRTRGPDDDDAVRN